MKYLSLLVVATVTSLSAAGIVYDENSSGDLSNDANSPTAFSFSLGENILTGSVVTGAPSDTRDFITFTIPSGLQLEALRLLDYSDLNAGGDGNRGFHAINLGSTSFVPSGSTDGDFMGGAHLDAAPANTDLLSDLALAPQAGTGFTVPLPAGDYSYVIQQTGPQLTGYSVAFDVAAVPEPSSGTLFMFMAVSVAGVARLRRHRLNCSKAI